MNDTYFNASFSGRDNLHLYTHYFVTDPAYETLVRDFPVQIATNGSGSPGVLGMGPSSTVLQELYNAGKIAGRTYSLYVGAGMDRAGGIVNGSNTFGGYDAGRFTGPVHEYAMDGENADALKVRVKDIIINENGGPISNLSLFDTEEFPDLDERPAPFEARITTDRYPMSLPFKITQNFINRLSAVESDSPDGSLRISRPFNGTMTIVLEDGFSVTLPPEVMFNASGLSPVASRDEDSDEPFYLSVAWLSQVYLMMDYDSFKFFLAPAVVEEKYVMPMTFCPRTVPQVYEPPKKSLGTTGMVGLIVAAVVGGIIFSLLGAVLFMAWQRKRMMRAAQRESMHGDAKVIRFDSDEEDSRDERQERKRPKLLFWKKS